MMHKSQFLQYKSSQIAATAILVAIDLNKSEVEKEKRNQSMSPTKSHNARNPITKYNTEKKRARDELRDHDALPVYQEQSGNDFDNLMAMENDCDLRKKGDSSSSGKQSSEQSSEDKTSQQTSFQKVWSKEVTQYTKVSKSKDILPVLRELVASLE